MIKNKAVNWSFDVEAFHVFRKDLWPIVEAVPGFLNISEAFFLYQTAKTLGGSSREIDQPKAGSVVEIGSYKGRSSVALALGIKHHPTDTYKLYCIDPFFDGEVDSDLQSEFQQNITSAEVADIATSVPRYSIDAAKSWPPTEGISFLFIDGNHEYEFVRDDFLYWSRFLVPGGVVAFHDPYLIGVRVALDKFLFGNDAYQQVCIIDGSLVAATRSDGWPTPRQRAIKKRVYWALRAKTTSPYMAILRMIVAAIDRPFGSLRRFFVEKLPVKDIN